MKTNKLLFVGGPLDGQRLEVAENASEHYVIPLADMAGLLNPCNPAEAETEKRIRRNVYRRISHCSSEGTSFECFICHDSLHLWRGVELVKQLAEGYQKHHHLLAALENALEWIDAVPSDTQLPAMPGFDRDEVNQLISDIKKGRL